jgi:hypothetical protein
VGANRAVLVGRLDPVALVADAVGGEPTNEVTGASKKCMELVKEHDLPPSAVCYCKSQVLSCQDRDMPSSPCACPAMMGSFAYVSSECPPESCSSLRVRGTIDGKVASTVLRVVGYTRNSRTGWNTTVDLWPETGVHCLG